MDIDTNIKIKTTPPLELHTLAPRPAETNIDNTADIRLGAAYRSLIGAIGYAAMMTRPDIAYHHAYLSRFSSNPATEHMAAAKHLLCYLKGTASQGITYHRSTEQLQLSVYADSDYADSDYASTVYDRCSISASAAFMNSISGAIDWSSKKQPVVAQSSCEAEYYALALALNDAMFLKLQLPKEFGEPAGDAPVTIYQDNQGTIALANNPVHHARAKHIDVRAHRVRELISHGDIQLIYVPTDYMVADALTKSLPRPKHSITLRGDHGATTPSSSGGVESQHDSELHRRPFPSFLDRTFQKHPEAAAPRL